MPSKPEAAVVGTDTGAAKRGAAALAAPGHATHGTRPLPNGSKASLEGASAKRIPAGDHANGSAAAASSSAAAAPPNGAPHAPRPASANGGQIVHGEIVRMAGRWCESPASAICVNKYAVGRAVTLTCCAGPAGSNGVSPHAAKSAPAQPQHKPYSAPRAEAAAKHAVNGAAEEQQAAARQPEAAGASKAAPAAGPAKAHHAGAARAAKEEAGASIKPPQAAAAGSQPGAGSHPGPSKGAAPELKC